MTKTERHPLEPFLPQGARLLMLGSFPPKRERWSMDFFYPNFNNDMWRIFGLVFFGDRSRFITEDGLRFDKAAITDFCSRTGIALYDTATEVRRLKDNASDKFLEIVTPTDLPGLLGLIPGCRAVVTTGQKAAETAAVALHCEVPAPGTFFRCRLCSPAPEPASGTPDSRDAGNHETGEVRELRLWRMPSSSRAYPLSLEAKAEAYRRMFSEENFPCLI